MSRNAFPAAVPVSTGCSVAFSATPRAFQLVHDVLEVLQRTRRRSMRVTTSVSPARRKSSSSCNSVRPSRRAPLAFSARISFSRRLVATGGSCVRSVDADLD
jgi:hypothetical protein